ncbi:hypothetical protein [Fibrobacter sp. UWP2]|nr:hypothetical protein [Fibrobacter sp. UWP2]
MANASGSATAGHDRMLITSGTETSGISHALAYVASLRLATPAHHGRHR